MKLTDQWHVCARLPPLPIILQKTGSWREHLWTRLVFFLKLACVTVRFMGIGARGLLWNRAQTTATRFHRHQILIKSLSFIAVKPPSKSWAGPVAGFMRTFSAGRCRVGVLGVRGEEAGSVMVSRGKVGGCDLLHRHIHHPFQMCVLGNYPSLNISI